MFAGYSILKSESVPAIAMAEQAPPFTGNYASHNHVANAPNNATVILAHPTYGDPTLYTLEQGLGVREVADQQLVVRSLALLHALDPGRFGGLER